MRDEVFHKILEVYRYQSLRKKLLTAILMRLFLDIHSRYRRSVKVELYRLFSGEKGVYNLTSCNKIVY